MTSRFGDNHQFPPYPVSFINNFNKFFQLFLPPPAQMWLSQDLPHLSVTYVTDSPSVSTANPLAPLTTTLASFFFLYLLSFIFFQLAHLPFLVRLKSFILRAGSLPRSLLVWPQVTLFNGHTLSMGWSSTSWSWTLKVSVPWPNPVFEHILYFLPLSQSKQPDPVNLVRAKCSGPDQSHLFLHLGLAPTQICCPAMPSLRGYSVPGCLPTHQCNAKLHIRESPMSKEITRKVC